VQDALHDGNVGRVHGGEEAARKGRVTTHGQQVMDAHQLR